MTKEIKEDSARTASVPGMGETAGKINSPYLRGARVRNSSRQERLNDGRRYHAARK